MRMSVFTCALRDVLVRARRAAKRTWPVGLVLVLALGAMSAVVAPAVAGPPSGTVNNPVIKTLFDGTATPNSVDDGSSNNVVAVNDRVGFEWAITANDLKDGILSQTIPACWTWDAGTFGTLDTDNSYYSSTYEIVTNPDGTKTLTARVSTKDASATGISFRTLTATVNGSCANGSTYTPTLTVTDAAGSRGVTAPAITVRSEDRSDLLKTASSNGAAGKHDFGAGEVDAFSSVFWVNIKQPENRVGAADTKLTLPISFEDVLAPTPSGVTLDTEVSGPNLPAGDTVSVSGSTVTISGPTPLSLAEVWGYGILVKVWIPASEVPNNGERPLYLRNQVSAVGDWGIGANDVNPNNNVATTSYVKPTTGGGGGGLPIAREKEIWVAQDPDHPVYGIDPASNPSAYQNVSLSYVAPHSVVVSRMFFHGTTHEDGTGTGSTDLVAYDFWDPAKQRLISDHGYYVGGAYDGSAPGPTELPPSSYRVQYTDGASTSSPGTANTWYDTVADAGGPAAVRGIRIAYTGGPVYGEGATGSDLWFEVALPFRIVAGTGEAVPDTAQWTSKEASTGVSQVVYVAPYLLQIYKSTNKNAYLSGDTIAYTITPYMFSVPGGPESVTVNPLKVVDTLPAEIISIDTSGLDPAWTVSQTTVNGRIVATFTHVGPVTSDDELPPITYTAQTSIVAPSNGALTNSAQLVVNGIDGPTATRTVAVQQANVTTKQKVSTVGPDIEVGDDVVSWKSTWINYQNTSQGRSSFVDVLPYNGDPRGTAFHGTAQLRSATLGGAAAGDGMLYYTTDAPGTVSAAPAASTTWVDAAGVDLSTVSGITALLVEIDEFAAGDAGVGSLAVELEVDGQRIGDSYANTVTGKTLDFTFGDGRPAVVDVVGSSLSGRVWNDLDADGTVNGAEGGIGGVDVALYDADDVQVDTTVTAADGTYTFDQLHSGGYHVVVDQPSVSTALGGGSVQTYDRTPPLDNDSGLVAVARKDQVGGVRFGYRAVRAELSLVKKTNGTHYPAAPGAAVAVGSAVTWTYEVTNDGNSPLTEVVVKDRGSDGTTPAPACQTPDGGLLPGRTMTCTAGASAIAGQYSNTAQATGKPVDDHGAPVVGLTSVTSNEDTSYYFGKTTGLTLVKKTNGRAYTATPDDFGAVGALVGAGSPVTWTYEVTNNGNAPVTGLEVTDAGSDETAPEVTCPERIAAGATVECTASGTAIKGQYENTASATATDLGGEPVTSNRATSWYFGVTAGLELVKLVNDTHQVKAPGLKVTTGSKVSWTYEVTNTGNYPVGDVSVADDGTDGTVAVRCPQTPEGGLRPGDTLSCTARTTAIEGRYENTATATSADPADGVAAGEATDQSWYHGVGDGPGTVGGKTEGGGWLPNTGGPALWALLVGLLCFAAGTGLVVARRRTDRR
ncbi:SdrD B-like domain-containing protein [Pimelobacter sp. 30-1]|uniref:DUF7507 domain-containing protein n=1 Tax=Pimelobacter sp. 30-1 TaxID=2004991 RepID=UPI001C05B266|nr:SdrD B-like domain-containing protein [Pimelobacter sp. 30-1]MBU2694468.1 hypothetical protein [Pimelobacter sp. 30-1]